ncbi:hypothetical protein ACQKM1_15300 [Peribacillus frigoritolerans]|uniref:hypothetical protein n=1 Tax=Peribacillus frigoritolerans TaxID=450367 RepID=UPI003CFDE1F8
MSRKENPLNIIDLVNLDKEGAINKRNIRLNNGEVNLYSLHFNNGSEEMTYEFPSMK